MQRLLYLILLQFTAVLVNNTVFILFGTDKDANPTSDLLVLDVRNVSAIAFSSKYPLDSTTASNNGTSDSSSTTNSNDSGNKTSANYGNENHLSNGAVIGIAVGCSIVVSQMKSNWHNAH